MITSPVNSAHSSNTVASAKKALKTEDFIKMMITQLQNQDPLEPAKNQELLAQMSQIGQLQSATQLQDALRSLVLQNQIGQAGSMIGKLVEGTNEGNQTVRGVVTAVRVEKDQITLELDSGHSLPMSGVTTIAPGPVRLAA